jgi:hypothetical protein
MSFNATGLGARQSGGYTFGQWLIVLIQQIGLIRQVGLIQQIGVIQQIGLIQQIGVRTRSG